MMHAGKPADARRKTDAGARDDTEWSFCQDGPRQWRWELRVTNGRVLVRSAVRFETREACMEDAANYGYSRSADVERT